MDIKAQMPYMNPLSAVKKIEDATRERHQLNEVQAFEKDKALDRRMDEKAREFEAVFLAEMLRPMMRESKLEKPFGGGHGERMFHSLLVDEYGKALSDAGGIGVADYVKREMIAAQAGAQQSQLKPLVQSLNEEE